ncbi:hypothetical protein [Halobacillus sp. B23F22_1]|uniref:hypothetical protein n=1 Tax=Halobacillus sp. B23F22_1 TaxID=3459514 RepID=UPI00373F5942
MNMKLINPAAASIVMALGIFLYGAIEAFPLLDQVWGKWLAALLTVTALVIYVPLAQQSFRKAFRVPFLNNPVNSFVMGAWIAGISVLCNVVLKYFPELNPWIQAAAIVNTCFWIVFIFYCVNNFRQLLQKPGKHSAHGVILLSTVATQSLVIVWTELFPFVSALVILSVLTLGLLFYLFGIVLIGIRYKSDNQWSLAEDWTNTNCIIHGALSITGLAIVSTQLMPPVFLLFFWLFVFSIVVLVEAVEIRRAFIRVRAYGWRKGLFTYNISQWSRNFTFGMFYAFTMMRHEGPYYLNLMYDFHEIILSIWAWVVLAALIVQIGLWLKANFHYLDRGHVAP